MIQKIVQISDIHIRNLNRLDESGEIIDKFVKDCKKLIKEYGKDGIRICVCGDIFENHISVSNEAIACCSYFFRSLDNLGCKCYVIGGNHDYSSANAQRMDSLSPIFSIGQYENVKYLDGELGYESGYLVDDNVVFCLYSQYDGFNRPDLIKAKADNEGKVFVGLVHCDVNGSENFGGIVSNRGLDVSIFDGLDFVMAGHIHKFQEIKKNGIPIVYSSSMVQHDFGETVSNHGYVVWNVEERTYEFVELPNKERGFYKFEINDPDDIDNNKEELKNL